MNTFDFKVKHQSKKTKARVGIIRTPHGDRETPGFVPVGTQATVKSLTPEELNTLGVQLFFVNTYHMFLRPGLDVISKAGGIHRFMGWNGPVITDSGGFQVFSLARHQTAAPDAFFEDARRPSGRSPGMFSSSLSEALSPNDKEYDQRVQRQGFSASQNGLAHPSIPLVKISDDGVVFRSHWDGSKHVFTPELSMQYQWTMGSDIHIAFDDCTPYPVTEKKAKISMERTHRWAERSLEEHRKQRAEGGRQRKPYQALYGVIQGSVYKDLRKESAKFISSLAFDGIAIGGVAVGESKKETGKVLDWVSPYLPPDKPRHLLGVGEIDDIFTLVEHGIDTFDCVQPTRLARTGRVYIHPSVSQQCNNGTMKQFEIDILKAEYAHDLNPIDKNCVCYTCTHFSRAYVHHLFTVRELLGYRLATIHNISFINSLMSHIRLAIKEGSLVALKEKWGI